MNSPAAQLMKAEKFRNNVLVDVSNLFKGNISSIKSMNTKCHARVVILEINLTTLSHDCNNLQASDALFATNTESVTEKGDNTS